MLGFPAATVCVYVSTGIDDVPVVTTENIPRRARAEVSRAAVSRRTFQAGASRATRWPKPTKKARGDVNSWIADGAKCTRS